MGSWAVVQPNPEPFDRLRTGLCGARAQASPRPAWYKHQVRQKLAMMAAAATGIILLGAAILLAYARSLTP